MSNTPTPNLDDINLGDFDEGYNEAEYENNDYSPVPDGNYQVLVDGVGIELAKTSGNPMLKWTLKILGPSHQGRLLWTRNVIMHGQSMKWLKRNLLTCGLELKRLSDLKHRLNELLDVKLEISKRTRGENENIYFNKRIRTSEEVLTKNDAAGTDDDIPFF